MRRCLGSRCNSLQHRFLSRVQVVQMRLLALHRLLLLLLLWLQQ